MARPAFSLFFQKEVVYYRYYWIERDELRMNRREFLKT